MQEYKIDIGAGRSKMNGYLTLDCDKLVNADIFCNIEDDNAKEILNKYINNCVELRCSHILEHLRPENKVKVMALFFDLLKPGGTLDIEVPLFPHPASIQDPTHISYWVKESFIYFIKGNKFGEAFAKRYSQYPVPLFELVERGCRVIGVSEYQKFPPEKIQDCWAYRIILKKPLNE